MESAGAGAAALTSFYIGIDVGTSGCRAIAIDNTNHIVGKSAVTLPASYVKAGHIVQNPHDWWLACHLVLDDLLAQIPRKHVKSIAVDGTSGTVLLCDADGTLQSDAYMYNDNNNQVAAKRIEQIAPRESAVHGTSSGLAKCLTLIDKYQPAKTTKCLNQADWIAGIFTQKYHFSDQNNSLKLGYDPVQQCWPEWMQALKCQDYLAENVCQPGDIFAPMAPPMANTFKLPETTKIIAGTTDSIAAFIATGCKQTGEAVTSLGSTLAIKLLTDHPIYAPEYGVYSHRLADKWLVGGASNTGGTVIKKYFDSAQISALSRKLDIKHATGLDYYPLLEVGERFPVNDNEFAPKLNPRPTSELLFFQGILEGIANIEKNGYKKLAQLGASYPTIVLTTGGGSINPAWQEMREQILQVPVRKAKFTEAAYGAA
ncbi:MAG TPA: carbohydrate kinase, partial [Gammaproteobacteria bacterium]|nr:carbohydrate kinase [Gammaproteobacteria bacterium]